MERKADRRVQKTKSQLRSGLAKLMQTKDISQITVKELVDEVDINRSTFYLHYRDINGLLMEIEEEMVEAIEKAICEHPIANHTTFYFIEDIYKVLAENREIGCALLGANGDMRFIQKIQHIIEENSRELLEDMFRGPEEDLKYFYSFCLNGCFGLVKTWLLEGADKTPELIAQLTFQMVVNVMEAFCSVSQDFG